VIADPLGELARLEPTWGSAPEEEVRAVATLGASTVPEAGARLAALEARSGKQVRREIRRALYKLEQRGLWSSPEPPPPPSTNELLGRRVEEPEGWLSAIDFAGNRLAWLARPLSHGVATLSAVVNDLSGIRELHAGETTRKALAQARKELADKHDLTLVEAPWAHVDALVARAFDATADRSGCSDYPQARALVVPHPPTSAPPPPVDALVDRALAAADAEALARSADALAEHELATWLLPLEWMKPTLEELDSTQQSVLVLSRAQKDERLRSIIEHAVDEILGEPSRREIYAGRLDESAYLLARRGALDLARALVAASAATSAGQPIRAVPVLAELTRRSLSLALQVEAERARDTARSSLVVSPAQALAEAQARSRQRR